MLYVHTHGKGEYMGSRYTGIYVVVTVEFCCHMKFYTTYSKTHQKVIIYVQSSNWFVGSVMAEPSSNVDGPSFIKSQLTSLYNI